MSRLEMIDWLIVGAVVFGAAGFLLISPAAALIYIAAVCIGLFLVNLLREAHG